MEAAPKYVAPVKSDHAKTWHIDDPEGPDGRARYHRTSMRRVFPADYKLAVLAEYDRCTEKDEKGALLRREGLYSSIIIDWRRQHRQGRRWSSASRGSRRRRCRGGRRRGGRWSTRASRRRGWRGWR